MTTPADEAVTTIACGIEQVWRELTSVGPRAWMAGAVVRSTWQVEAPVEIDVVLEGEVRHDRGTVLDAQAPTLLRYSLWSAVSRRPDRPENRTVVSFELETIGDKTRVTVRHTGLRGVAGPHAAFFWPVALARLRDVLEGRDAGSSIQILG